MSDTKENENEESDQEHVAVGSDEHEPHQPDSQNGNKIMESLSNPDLPTHDSPPSQLPLTNQQDLVKPEPDTQPASDVKTEDHDLLQKTNSDAHHNNNNNNIASEPTIALAKTEPSQVVPDTKIATNSHTLPTTTTHNEPCAQPSHIKSHFHNGREFDVKVNAKYLTTPVDNGNSNAKHSFLLDDDPMSQGTKSGTEEEQSAFMKELEIFFRERSMEFKPPKFYGEGLNCLKYVFLVIYIHIVFFIYCIYVGTLFLV